MEQEDYEVLETIDSAEGIVEGFKIFLLLKVVN